IRLLEERDASALEVVCLGLVVHGLVVGGHDHVAGAATDQQFGIGADLGRRGGTGKQCGTGEQQGREKFAHLERVSLLDGERGDSPSKISTARRPLCQRIRSRRSRNLPVSLIAARYSAAARFGNTQLGRTKWQV